MVRSETKSEIQNRTFIRNVLIERQKRKKKKKPSMFVEKKKSIFLVRLTLVI